MAKAARARSDARIEEQCRADLASFAIPLDEYTCTVERGEHDHSPVDVIFRHRETEAEILVTAVWIDDDGGVLQAGSHYGRLEF